MHTVAIIGIFSGVCCPKNFDYHIDNDELMEYAAEEEEEEEEEEGEGEKEGVRKHKQYIPDSIYGNAMPTTSLGTSEEHPYFHISTAILNGVTILVMVIAYILVVRKVRHQNKIKAAGRWNISTIPAHIYSIRCPELLFFSNHVRVGVYSSIYGMFSSLSQV